MKEKGSKW